MNSRERIRAAIAHRQPDRVPVDLGGTPSSGISAMACNKLTSHLGLTAGATRVFDTVQQLAQPEEALLDRLGADVLDLGRTFDTEPADWYDVTLADGSTAQYPAGFRPQRQADGSWIARLPGGRPIARMPAGGAFFDQNFFPFLDGYPPDMSGLPGAMGQVLWAALARSPWNHAGEPDFWATLRRKALELRARSDRALTIICGCNLFEWGTFLRRLDQFLMDLYLNPADVERLLEALMEIHLATLERVCAAVGDVADVLRFGDDLGLDQGPFMDPATYRKVFKPRHAKLCAYVHAHSGMKTMLHSCGSIAALLPDLIEAGYDAINPVQTNAAGMDPAGLKRQFGNDIAFWGGGCDTRHVLNRATPDAVRRHVLERLEIFAPGGGFVFNTIHNILPEVPPQNIMAMFEAIKEFNGE